MSRRVHHSFGAEDVAPATRVETLSLGSLPTKEVRLTRLFGRPERLAMALVVLATTLFVIPLERAHAAAPPPPKCFVGWRPSEGSVSFNNTGTNQTLMVVKTKWRPEDLTFRTCRFHTATEMEIFFGLSNARHKLGNFTIIGSDLPGMYLDSARNRNPREVTFGVGDAEKLAADKMYTTTYRFSGRLGTDERLLFVAARNFRRSNCVGGHQWCVVSWTQPHLYGPDERPNVLADGPSDFIHVVQGGTYSWSFPPRSTLNGKIIRHPVDKDAHLLDENGVRHWIENGTIYNCLVAKGIPVVNSFAGYDQRTVISSFPQGENAKCTGPSLPPPSAQISLSQGAPAPAGYWYDTRLSGFSPGSSVTVTCRDSADPGGFYSQTFTIDGAGQAADSTLCYSGDGPDHWVTGGGVESNHVRW